MSANIRELFEETPRPGPLPTFPFPNDHPFAIRWKDSPGLPVPVGVGPLSTYHEHIQIPFPGEPGAPPPCIGYRTISFSVKIQSPFLCSEMAQLDHLGYFMQHLKKQNGDFLFQV